MKKDNLIYIGHILETIEKIEKYCGNKKKSDFLKNDVLKDAVVRNVEIIGEASKKLSSDFKKSHGNIPWKDIAGMRDKIVHDYTGIDFEIVWDVVKKDLPALKKALKQLS